MRFYQRMRAIASIVRFAAAICLLAGTGLSQAPEIEREFRALWIATVYNIDWPSKAGLKVQEQKDELIDLLDTAKDGGINAIILQVRPEADALYESGFEPWSAHLTGEMGLHPGYDPLAFAIEQAHERGMELHAWFNPFRAQANRTKPRSPNHIANTRPDWIKRYANYLWLDPGNPEVRAYSIQVMLDVVRRYDIDGVHIDDYFYPYPYPSNDDAEPFPDDDTYERFGRGDKDDWRRANVDRFIEALHKGIKKEKPWVRFGISPFGIWRPGYPKGTEAGLDAYGLLYADSRKWLRRGWMDYMMPQLYWTIDSKGQSFPKLLDWWIDENRKKRHVWPGIATDRVGDQRPASEMAKQIDLIRKASKGHPGHSHWSADSFINNQRGVRELLQRKTYAQRALTPPNPWLKGKAPSRPAALLTPSENGYRLRVGLQENVRFWLIQTRTDGEWSVHVEDGRKDSIELGRFDAISVSAVGYNGALGKPTAYEFE